MQMNVPQGGESWRALARWFSVFPIPMRHPKTLVYVTVWIEKTVLSFENTSIILQRTVIQLLFWWEHSRDHSQSDSPAPSRWRGSVGMVSGIHVPVAQSGTRCLNPQYRVHVLQRNLATRCRRREFVHQSSRHLISVDTSSFNTVPRFTRERGEKKIVPEHRERFI